jgi:thymidylate synthase
MRGPEEQVPLSSDDARRACEHPKEGPPMHIEEESIDDILNRVYTSLLSNAKPVRTSKGQTAEVIGALLRLNNPRARLSSSETRLKLFSALGEFVWYVAGSDDPEFIAHYIPWYKNVKLDGGRVPGAYGPRLFGSAPNDQFRKAIQVLRERRTSRRAVAQLYRAEDLALSIGADSTSELLEVPCTCTLQFLIREETLQLVVHMRSNDAYRGLPHDVFCFTMLQELVARALGIEPGIYVHSVGSLHLYEEDWQWAREYLQEGWHSMTPMPPMPGGDQANNIAELVRIERRIRTQQDDSGLGALPTYWRDIATLLRAHSRLEGSSLEEQTNALRETREQVSCDAYKRYLLDREHASALLRP